MIFAAYIAICLAGTPLAECNKDSAVVWTRAPGTHTLGFCQFTGMAFVADNNLAQPGEVVKVFCRSANRPGNVG